MEIIISSNTSKPIYEQITSQIKAMIMSGELKTGDPNELHRAGAIQRDNGDEVFNALGVGLHDDTAHTRSEEHTTELQSQR